MEKQAKDTQAKLMEITEHLFKSPMMAFQDWPFWIGFAGLEYASAMVQRSVSDVSSGSTQQIINAITRGFILTTNLSYWDSGHGKGPDESE